MMPMFVNKHLVGWFPETSAAKLLQVKFDTEIFDIIKSITFCLLEVEVVKRRAVQHSVLSLFVMLWAT